MSGEGPSLSKLRGHFPGESEDILGKLVEGLVQDGAVAPPNPELLGQLASLGGMNASVAASLPQTPAKPATTKVAAAPPVPPAAAPKPTVALPPKPLAPVQSPPKPVTAPLPVAQKPAVPAAKPPTAVVSQPKPVAIPPAAPKPVTAPVISAQRNDPAVDKAAADAAISKALDETSESGIFQVVSSTDPISLGISKRLPSALSPDADGDFAHEEEADDALMGELTRGGTSDEIEDEHVDEDDIAVVDSITRIISPDTADGIEPVPQTGTARATSPGTAGVEQRAPTTVVQKTGTGAMAPEVAAAAAIMGGATADVERQPTAVVSMDAKREPTAPLEERTPTASLADLGVAQTKVQTARVPAQESSLNDVLAGQGTAQVSPDQSPTAAIGAESAGVDINSIISGIESQVGAPPATPSSGGLDIDALINSTFGGEPTPPDAGLFKDTAQEIDTDVLSAAEAALGDVSATAPLLDAAPESMLPPDVAAPLPDAFAQKKISKGTKAWERTEELSDEELLSAASELLCDIADELQGKGEQVPVDLLKHVGGSKLVSKAEMEARRARQAIAAASETRPDTAKLSSSEQELVRAPTAIIPPKPIAPSQPTAPVTAPSKAPATQISIAAPKPVALATPAAKAAADKVGTRPVKSPEDKLAKRITDAMDLADAKTMVLTREQMEKAGKELVGVGEQPLYQVVLGVLGFVAFLSGLGIYAWFVLYTGAF